MTFDSFGLSPALLRGLAATGYTTPTPIQVAAIPIVLAGGDLLAAAQTGTGKTAGFALPLLQRLDSEARPARLQGRRPRALILTPTRELAAQVHDFVHDYGRFLDLKSAVIFGGVSFGPQQQALARGVDVLVATPGRLIDHLQRGTANLGGIEVLVLDEADRMLDMGFLPAIRRLLAKLPTRRQTLLFSATFSPEVKALAQQFTHNAREVQVAPPNSVVASVDHRVHPVDASRKRDLLLHILAEDSRRQALVFARTKHGADKLAKFLDKSGLRTAAIHGNKSQNQRTRALAGFKDGSITILVATDIAARGLDIHQLPLVVNFDLPNVPQDYVHRIGRTGRAGATGLAVSLVAPEEAELLRDIQKLLKQDIPIVPVPGFEPPRPLDVEAHANHGKRKTTPTAKPQAARNRGRGNTGRNGDNRRDKHAGERPRSADANRGARTDAAAPAAKRRPRHGHRRTTAPQAH